MQNLEVTLSRGWLRMFTKWKRFHIDDRLHNWLLVLAQSVRQKANLLVNIIQEGLAHRLGQAGIESAVQGLAPTETGAECFLARTFWCMLIPV